MSKVLVLYYSAYGHLETMAEAIAAGARDAGAQVDIKRVPETVPEEIARSAHFKLDQSASVATIADLENYDAIIIGTGTRFGRISSQMASFLDQAGGLWARGALNGKVGAAFTATGSQHGGQETTLFSIITNLLHFGMTIVGLDYGFAGQTGMTRCAAARPMVQQRSPVPMAAVNQMKTNWKARAISAAVLRQQPQSCSVERRLRAPATAGGSRRREESRYSNFCSFGEGNRVVNIDAEIANGILDI